MVWITAFHDCL